jgi:RNA polymerase sigma factor (sigma-70 family)
MPDDASNASPTAPPEVDRWKTVNDLYVQWKNAPENEKESIVHRLYPHLQRHAEWMVWNILHRADEHLACEMVNDLLMKLETFQRRSKFSTWAHSCFENRCLDKLRYQKRRSEESWDAASDLFREQNDPLSEGPETDDEIHLDQRLNMLDRRNQAILEARLCGQTMASIGKKHGITKAGVRHILRHEIPVQLGLG